MPVKFRSGDRDRLYAFAKKSIKPDPALDKAHKDAVEALTVHLEEVTKKHYGNDLDALKRHGAVSAVSEHMFHAMPPGVREKLRAAEANRRVTMGLKTARPIYHHCRDALHKLPDLKPELFVAVLETAADVLDDIDKRLNDYQLFIKAARNWDEVLAIWPAAKGAMADSPIGNVPSPITKELIDRISTDNAGG